MKGRPSSRRHALGTAAAVLVAALLPGCSPRFTPSEAALQGRWHADKFGVSESLKLPIGPDLQFLPGAIEALGQRFPYESLQVKGDSVHVELGGIVPIGLVFRFETADEIHFELPLMLGEVVYRRVK